MHRPSVLLLLWIIFTAGLWGANQRIVITGATLIDGTGSPPQAGRSVVIADGIIVELVDDATWSAQPGDRVIDARGQFLIPGLWDMHFHITLNDELAPRMFALLLAHGITGVRDVGGLTEKVLYWRNQARENPRRAPRVAVAGPLIDGDPTVYDGALPHRPNLSATVRNAEEARQVVDELAAAGVDFLKTYEMLSADSFRALLERAEYHGLRVAGHVPFAVDAGEASDLGMGSMEHLRNVELASAADAESLLHDRRQRLIEDQHLHGGDLRSAIHRAQRGRALDAQSEDSRDELLARFARNGTAQVPTLVIMAGSRIQMNTDPAWMALLKQMPASMRESWEQTHARLSGMSAEEWEPFHRYADWLLETTRLAYEAGVPVLPGTDAPIPLALPGHSLHEELRGMVLAGIPEMAVIQAATLESARWLGMAGETGSIAPGKAADLVLLDADPRESITHTRVIAAVIRAGRLFDRDELAAMLQTGVVPAE